MDFSEYLGRRTPGYPLLLVMGGMNQNAVWMIQSGLGVSISVLIFFLALECVPSIGLGFAAALLQSMTLNQLFFEASMLSETLATFLVVASVLLFVRTVRDSASSGIFAVLGLCCAMATLTRPLYIYLGPLYLALLLIAGQGHDKRRIFVLIGAFCMPILGWAAFNKATIDYFGLTSQLGISLSQHSGKFIDKAPDEFATIRDIYLQHKAEMPPDLHHMSTWEAVPDMLAATRLSFVDLNRQLTKLSLFLFVHYPDLYLRSVFDAWISFWAVPNPWTLDLVRSASIKAALTAVWGVEHIALRATNLVFFILALFLGPRAFVSAIKDQRVDGRLVFAGVVLGASLVQALLEATDNARYSIPTQPLVVLFVLTSAFEFSRKWQGSRGVT